MSNYEKFNRANVGGVIYALRNDLNIGQSALSKELGISQGSISKIEHGTLEVGISLYYEILKYFKLDSNQFSELVDKYIKATLKAQKANIQASKQKEKVSNEIAKQADRLRDAR